MQWPGLRISRTVFPAVLLAGRGGVPSIRSTADCGPRDRSCGTQPRSLGRRDADFGFDRVFIPSLIVDHAALVLRQADVRGEEGFAVWAGTLSGGDAYVAPLVIPAASAGPAHGEIWAYFACHRPLEMG